MLEIFFKGRKKKKTAIIPNEEDLKGIIQDIKV